MPKKKKNLGVSPSRKNINSESIAAAAAGMVPSPVDLAMSQASHGVNKEELFSSFSEMFSDLDPTVVYMVLSECDFRVEDTMDYLLELSTAAKGVTFSSEISGFDSISALLVGENQSASVANEIEGQSSAGIKFVKPNEELPTSLSSEKLIYLLQNSSEKHNLNSELGDSKNDHISGNLSLDHTSSSCFKELSEHTKSNLGYSMVPSLQKFKADSEELEAFSRVLHPDHHKTSELVFRKSIIQTNSLDDVGAFAQNPENCILPEVVLDSAAVPEVISANMEVSCTNPDQIESVSDFSMINSTPVQLCQELAKSETSAADSFNCSSLIAEKQENAVAVCNTKSIFVPDLCPGSSFNLAPLENVNPMFAETSQHFAMLQKHSQEPIWNLMAPAFCPQSTSHSFVTPVAANPGKWSPASNYKNHGNIHSRQATMQPWDSSSSLQQAWEKKDGNQKLDLSQARQLPVCRIMRRKTPLAGHVLVLLRGVPGSGKSYLARALLEDNPSGIILSTDDYFYQKNGQYQFDAYCLGEAHAWNWKHAKEAFEKRITPIIIDNTNIQAWEMKPYVVLSQQHKYKVLFREPDTWWKFKPKELERRNIHGVSKEKIKRMLERYERCLTVNSVLNSSVPDELKNVTYDEVLHEEKGQREQHESYGNNEEPSVSIEPLKHISIDDKHLLDRVAQEDQSLQNEKTEAGLKLLECNSECDIPVGDQDIYIPPNKGTVDPVLVTEVNKTGLMKSEENAHSCMHISENVQEHNNQNLEFQAEANQYDKILKEAELTEKKYTNEEDSDFEKSMKSERLNFVGDWPIEQTMGQRIKRARKLEKLTIKNDKEDRCINVPSLDSLKVLDDNEKLDLIDGHKELPLRQNKQEENNQSSACTSSIDKDEDTSELLMLGDWPIQDSLEQRQHKARRIPKRSISESEETGNNQCDNKNTLSTVAVLPEASAGSRKPCVSSKEESFQAPKISPSEALNEKKPMQNKRTRKHHKLALTFTNNLVLSKPQDQLSLFNLLEEKYDEYSSAEASKCSQTEPQDFALLWRLERKIIVSEGPKVLHGRLEGFIPKDVDETSAYPKKVPFKVSYDKSTYVEESELVSIDESENLNILCKLFGSFSFDALKDLYERCNRDIDWATGILLDSAEKICKDDDIECLQDAEALEIKTDANLEEKLADSEETAQVSGISTVIQGSEITDFSVDSGGDKTSDCSLSEITNLLATVSPGPSVENENFSHNVQKAQIEQLNIDEFLLNTMKIQTKEITPVPLLENERTITLQNEIDSYISVTVPSYFSESPTPLKPTFDEGLANSFSKKHQELAEIEDTVAQELLAKPVFLDHSVSNESKFETYEGMNCKPALSVVAENENGKKTNQEDKTKLLNPKPTSKSVSIDCLELLLPPELAIQLSEIFGPVGLDSGSLTTEDYVVHIDLNLAKEIHEKWKASIKKRQRRTEKLHELLLEDPMLFEQLCLDDLDSALSQHTNDQEQTMARLPADTLAENSRTSNIFPFMDHWNVQTQQVSLRAIMSEEIALQEKELKRPFMARKDCAAKLKEKQLLELFPTIHPNFLIDIFKDYNYSLEQTVQFLNSVLEADPVQTVVAKETTQGASLPYSASKIREKKAKKSKEAEDTFGEIFQDFEYPEYDDFRAEAFLHQKHRQECLRKAGEAYRMGMKPVAAFYVQQSRLHEQKMKEANHDAAVQIFEKVNASLLPENVLDLHGLHVDEALDHLCRILQEKTEEYNQAGGKPYLCVITGKGNHSQGRVARIKPAVMKYLTSHKFRFTEMKSGCLKVMLK